ncbi:hypothetical protein [Mycobacterium kyorinense]|uniref:DUF732 domain-containing protein n=1 Tax=Mycobacterium kyorinense TaxID=487514 RepID=A0A1X1XC03_9MYCO|nr:hypothetical protein [Mycobacterium kyorinense]ORV96218.1 hypothetical protein AWC14_16850 [Mycobacterium kyorinense]
MKQLAAALALLVAAFALATPARADVNNAARHWTAIDVCNDIKEQPNLGGVAQASINVSVGNFGWRGEEQTPETKKKVAQYVQASVDQRCPQYSSMVHDVLS